LGFAAAPASAEPLSKKLDVDFFRDVPSRNLKGLATRSDGRLVGGPLLAEISAPAPADLLWCIEPTPEPTKFLVGTGPDGKIVELTFNAANATFGTRDVAKLDDPQVFALKRLRDGSILAGTSPKGALCLIRDGKVVSRALLPVDSIFDLLVVDDNTALAATGNPGRIYRVDLRKFAGIGLIADKITDAKILAERGLSVFGEIRDRNVRRLAAMPDGRIAAGSSPRGNVYSFPSAGGAPLLLQENRDAEVTDLSPQPNGDLYASIVYSGTTGEGRVTASSTRGGGAAASSGTSAAKEREPELSLPPVQVEKFAGRSAVVWFPANGFPETVTARSGVAFYRLARHGDTLVIAGGESGDILGYDIKARLSVTFPGSISAQLNGIVPIANAPGKFLLLRNNAPGLALLDFSAGGPREAETRRLDLSSPSLLGAVRFNRLRNLDPKAIGLELRVNYGTDEAEGWSAWTPLKLDADGGWRAENLRGRSARLRVRLPAGTAASDRENLEIDRAALFSLPQNRRPQLQEFRVLTPGYGLIPAVEQPASPVVTINQLLQSARGDRDDDSKRGGKGSFNSSQIVPQPGAQLVLWTVTDPDGDNLSCTFSIRREGDENWTDVVTSSRDPFAQFDTGHLPDGIYFTRLVATEIAPRPAAERLSQTFETDDLIVDHTAPEVIEATARRSGDSVIVSVHGRDKLSLLDNLDVTFTNGVHETVEQPADGIRDGRDETFVLEVPVARVSNATSVEITLYDASGNSVARRLTW
jgi:hypothetical protein